MPLPSDLLTRLTELVEEAGELALSEFGKVGYELKADGSLVTPTDRKVELFLGPRLKEIVPAAIWGEEEGFAAPSDEGLWLIDPIDGTSNFSFGIPLWGVTVGLYRRGKLELGVVTLPCLKTLISAELGKGAYRNGERMPQVRSGPINEWELVGHGDLDTPRRHNIPGKTRHFGAFVLESVGFLTQGLRAMTSSNCRLYDAAGSIVAAREIGATLVHFDGRPFNEAEWVNQGTPLEPFAMLPPGCGVFGV